MSNERPGILVRKPKKKLREGRHSIGEKKATHRKKKRKGYVVRIQTNTKTNFYKKTPTTNEKKGKDMTKEGSPEKKFLKKKTTRASSHRGRGDTRFHN